MLGHRTNSRAPRAALALAAAVALAVCAAPVASYAAEGTDVADELLEHLYVPDGVRRGEFVDEDGNPLGPSPVYSEIAADSGISAYATLPASFDLRDQGAVTSVKNQYRWQDCWVFGSVGSLESNLIMQGRATADIDLSELQLTAVRRSTPSQEALDRLGASSQTGEGIEPLSENLDVSAPYGSYAGISPENLFLLCPGYVYEPADAIFSGMAPVSEEDAPFRGELDESGKPLDETVEYLSKGYDYYGCIQVPDGSSSWKLDDPYADDPEYWLDASLHLGSLATKQTDEDGWYVSAEPNWDAAERVKSALMQNGAVSLSLRTAGSVGNYDNLYYNADQGAQYVYHPSGTTHIVTLVGWDDTYPASNFDTGDWRGQTPPGDGAWIIKDSYGTGSDNPYPCKSGYQESGYRYVSYYDMGLGPTTQLIAGDDYETSDIVLQYDLTGTSDYSDELLFDQQAACANVFTAEEDMLLEATTVSAAVNNSRAHVEVYLLDASAQNPTDGELVAEKTEVLACAGRYRVELDDPVVLRAGQRFSIVEEVSAEVDDEQTGSVITTWYLSFEGGADRSTAIDAGSTYVVNAKSNRGESYVMTNGAWADATTLNESDLPAPGQSYGNATIKAYGSELESALPFSDVSVDTPHLEDILWLAETGISTGWKEDDGTVTFRGMSPVVRQDMAAFLHRLADHEGASFDESEELEFSDVSESTPHFRDILWLAATGISEGWEEGGSRVFRSMNEIVRQDMAAFLYRLAGSPKYEPTDEDRAYFSDVDESTPHYREVLWLYSTGVSEGWDEEDGTHTFRGMDTVKRQDMAAFLHRMSEKGLVG